MRSFSWNYFWLSGDVDVYLLFKEIAGSQEAESPREASEERNDEQALESFM
ncbi:YqzL family protein [Paenibacillus larvae]